jgi:predicted methyltransferase
MRRYSAILFATGFLVLAGGREIRAASPVPPHIAAAVADFGRPPAERALDAARKPGEMLAFADIKRGDKVADLMPGGGYFTRVFSKAVGPKGHVYAIDPDDLTKMHGDTLLKIVADPAYSNVTLKIEVLAKINTPEPVDVVWTAQNYHDLHNADSGSPDMVAFNRAIFAMLKPGGVYIVLDHAAAPDAPADVTDKLHRIPPEVVKKEVLAAGFAFEGESDALRNAADDHSVIVFNPKIRGKTDQFILKFRKPK